MGTSNSSLGKLSAHTSQKVESKEEIIWNLTQHLATPEQREVGVRDLPEELRQQLVEILTFDYLPDDEDLQIRCGELLVLIGSIHPMPAPGTRFMIGGAPFFMEMLSAALRHSKLRPVFAFSKRESVEQAMPDGSIRKTAIFRHLGFVEPEAPRK